MIFGLINRNSGPGFHRIHMPLLLMPDTDVYITNAIEEKHFEEKKPKAIFYNRLISDDIIRLQAKYHFKIVVDIDDYWHLDQSHILHNYHYENRVADHQIKHLQLADIVTTTHERLAENIYPYNRNVIVIPNAIPKHEYFPVEKTEPAAIGSDKPTRVFWQGSVTHENDIAILRNPVKRLDKTKFMMVMAGFMEEEEAWHRMASMYTNGLGLKGVILPGLPPHQYYSSYKYADVCVAPLQDSLFNSMKSNLKVLEAAHSGLPCIASYVHPYLDIPTLPVKKQSDWFKWLCDKDAQEENAKELSEYATRHFDFDVINLKRKECFN